MVYASTNKIEYKCLEYIKKERKYWFLKRPHISIKKEYEGEIDRNKLSVSFLSGNCVQGKFIWIVIRDSVFNFPKCNLSLFSNILSVQQFYVTSILFL